MKDWMLFGCKQQSEEIIKEGIAKSNPPQLVVVPPGCPILDMHNINALCKKEGIDIINLKSRKSLRHIKLSKNIVVCRFFIIKDIFLLNHNFFNIHSSLLPRWAGIHPVEWAIVNGDQKTGVTMHKVTSEIDKGEVFFQEEVDILLNEDINDVRKKINVATRSIISRFLDGNNNFDNNFKYNDYSWARKRVPEDSEFFWNMNAIDIHNLVRAMKSPAPNAYFMFKENRIEVIESYLSKKTKSSIGKKIRNILKTADFSWDIEYDDATLSIKISKEFNMKLIRGLT